MEYNAELVDRLWESMMPFVEENELDEIARNFILISKRFGITDWSETAIEAFVESYDVDLDDDDDDDEIEDDDKFRLTAKGKATVKLLIQTANLTQTSILDVIRCGIDSGCVEHGDFDTFLLEPWVDEVHPLFMYTDDHEPATIPHEDEENSSLFHQLLIMCACGLSSAFEKGGPMEGCDLKEFLAERP